MRLTRTSAPVGAPITVDEAAEFCRVNHAEENDLIGALVETAVDLLDGPTGILGRAIISQEWRLELSGWPQSIALPIEPVSAVIVSYFDAAGAEQVLDASAYTLVPNPGAATVLAWSSAFVAPDLQADVDFPVIIDMTCGFGAAEDVPAAIKQAVKMLVRHWYDHRGAASGQDAIPLAVSALLARYRRML